MVFYKQLIIILAAGFTQCMCTKKDSVECEPNNKVQKINGVSLVAPRDSISDNDLKPLYDIGPQWVALMPFSFMKDKDPNLRFDVDNQWWGEKAAGVKHMANLVRKKNIKVMLKPQIWVYDNNLYTGFIEMNSEQDWVTFEQKYKDFMLHYAKIAEQNNIEMLCIGTELEKFVTMRPNYWLKLISEIKKVYTGKLTYAANWDEYKRVGFWKQIDYIGIDAYFPVSAKQSPTKEDIIAGWQPHIATLKAFSEQHQKKIIFTEYGYRSMDYTGKEPWDASNGSKVNLQAQVDAYNGFFESVYKEDWLSGGFIWKWFTNHPKSGGSENNRFTPQNKPAQETLKKQFSLN